MTADCHGHRAPAAPRLLCALAASLLFHVWLAREFPAGAPRNATQPGLTVHLAPGATSDAIAPVKPEVQAAGMVIAPPAPEGAAPRESLPSLSDTHAGAHTAPGGAARVPHPDPTYYPARQLDVYPALLSPLMIVYPEPASREQRTGRVLVLVLIDAAGRVDDVGVVEADPAGYFEDAARRTLAAAQFSPARRAGLPVKSRVLIHLDFDRRESGIGRQR